MLKISLASYSVLHSAVLRAQSEVTETLGDYLAKGLSAKRYRWDMLWYATARILPKNWVCDTLYNAEDLNDNHIDSALRAITNTK